MKENIAQLLHEKELLTSRLKKMLNGTIEIREKNNSKYIYLHYREDGIKRSKYAGEYSVELYNLILENNQLAKEYKKRLKAIKKELGLLAYQELELSDEIKINIDLARRNLVDSIYKQARLEGVATTYSDTETIVNGGRVSGMTSSDILKVVNLKRAWEFIMGEGVLSMPTNFAILENLSKSIKRGYADAPAKINFGLCSIINFFL